LWDPDSPPRNKQKEFSRSLLDSPVAGSPLYKSYGDIDLRSGIL